MAIVALFESSLTPTEYQTIIAGLSQRGLGAPDGRIHHTAWEAPDGWRVLDLWESEEKLGKFAEVLMPLMDSMGISVPAPKVYPVHNVIVG